MGPTLIIFSFWSPNPKSVPQQFSWQSAPVEWKIRILSLASLTSCPMGCHAQRGPMPNRALCPTGALPNGVPCPTGRYAQRGALPNGAPCPTGCHAQWGAMPNGVPCPTGRYAQRGAMSSLAITNKAKSLPIPRGPCPAKGTLPCPWARCPVQMRATLPNLEH